MSENRRGERLIRRYSESLKRKVVEEISSGALSIREAMIHYDVPYQRTINRWQQKYGERRLRTRIVRIEMKSDAEKIRELEKALAELTIDNRMKGALLEAYQELVPDFKKKLNAEQLKEFEEKEAALKRLRLSKRAA